jgi:hypothetical protein
MMALLFAFPSIFILSGCRGPEGPAGVDASGVDILPPTIRLINPWPLGRYWDELLLSAAAVDNVAIDRVVFTLDGAPAVGSFTMISTKDTSRIVLPLDRVTPGWHFISARAYDLAGNATEAAPRPVWLGHSDSLSDVTDTVAYHNGITAGVFTIPDSARAEAFWVRVTPAKAGYIRSTLIRMGGSFTDTSEVQIAVWTGTTVPSRAETTMTIPAVVVEGGIQPQRFNFGERGFRVQREFFLVFDLLKRSAEDTFRIAADDGSPPWGRSGSKDDGGWQLISERYGSQKNIILDCDIYYPEVPPDTSGD